MVQITKKEATRVWNPDNSSNPQQLLQSTHQTKAEVGKNPTIICHITGKPDFKQS
jgi:hypothetical protein